jgi:hypothetical protein
MIIDIPNTDKYLKSNLPSTILQKQTAQKSTSYNTVGDKFFKQPKKQPFIPFQSNNYVLQEQRLMNKLQETQKRQQELFMKNFQLELEEREQVEKIRQLEALQNNYYFSYFKDELEEKIKESYRKKIIDLNQENLMIGDDYKEGFRNLLNKNQELDKKIKEIERNEENYKKVLNEYQNEIKNYDTQIENLQENLEKQQELTDTELLQKNEEILKLLEQRDIAQNTLDDFKHREKNISETLEKTKSELQKEKEEKLETQFKLDTEQTYTLLNDTNNFVNKLQEMKDQYNSSIDYAINKIDKRLEKPQVKYLQKDVNFIKYAQNIYNLDNLGSLLTKKIDDAFSKDEKANYKRLKEVFLAGAGKDELNSSKINDLSKYFEIKDYSNYINNPSSIREATAEQINFISQDLQRDLHYYERVLLTPEQKAILGL